MENIRESFKIKEKWGKNKQERLHLRKKKIIIMPVSDH